MEQTDIKKVNDYKEYDQIEIIGPGWMLSYPSKVYTKEYKEFKKVFKDILEKNVLVAKEIEKGKKVCLYV